MVDAVKDWIGEHLYDNTLSITENIVRAVTNGSFPTANRIVLKEMLLDLGQNEKIIFPENVTLKNCQITSGTMSFHHGTADAIAKGAKVVACGSDATANAIAEGTMAEANACGATANATVSGASARARASGATANATADGASADASAGGAIANATVSGASAYTTASGAKANAAAGGAEAYATASGSTANATVSGAQACAYGLGTTANASANGARAHARAYGTANATGNGAIALAFSSSIANATAGGAQAIASDYGTTANASANGAQAIADEEGTMANATVAGALATARQPKSIAIARHELALTSLGSDKGKTIPYSEARIISENLDRFFDDRNRAEAAYMVGMAFCDGRGVKQSDTLATFFLSRAHIFSHRYAAFELGELYSKKRIWFRRDQTLADRWYSWETSYAKKIRELAPKYALLVQSLRENKSTLHGLPEDVIKLIGSLLGRL
jgi:hypothetical protein